MRPRLLSIYADLIDLETWRPEIVEDTMVPVIVEVTWDGEEATHLFYVRVATPEACRKHLSGFALSSRGLLLVSRYSYKDLEFHIRKIVETAVAETLTESCLALSRFFEWEYDNFKWSDSE